MEEYQPMETMKKRISTAAIYVSPHGTTRKAIEALAASLTECGMSPDVLNLSEFINNGGREKLYRDLSEYELIIFGSPTYFHHAPPVLMEFIDNMPETKTGQAVALLSTFGGVSSGVILYDMAKILYKKKYRLMGGAKVLTEHCLTFQADTPFYSGHPDDADLEVVADFGKEIVHRLQNENNKGYLPDAFNDKPFLLNFIDDYINKIENMSWSMPSVKVKQSECTGCGLCVKNCPTNNIELADNIAIHKKNCTYCYSCVRICPSNAARAYLKPAVPVVKWLAKKLNKYEGRMTRQVV